MVIRVIEMVKEERKNDQMYKFWHGYDGLVLVIREDTNIRPGYIGHQHLNDGLMSDVQVWMSTGPRDYGYEGGYTPVYVQVRVYTVKKIKAVKVVVVIIGVR
ncbi:hypothetical protein ACLOJK_004351 [Asimina triloba]